MNSFLAMAVGKTLAIGVLAQTGDAWPDDFAPPPWRSSPLTVHAEWEFTQTCADPCDAPPEYFDCVGDGNHAVGSAWTHVYIQEMRFQLSPDGHGVVMAREFVEGELWFFLRNWETSYLYKPIWIQITYGGEGVPEVYAVEDVGGAVTGEFVEFPPGAGAGQRIELWRMSPSPNREWIKIRVPPSTWVDEVIIDTIASPESAPAGGIPNDNCENAMPIGEVADLPFSTKTATRDSGTCSPTGGGESISPNIWFLYTPSGTGLATFDINGIGPCGSEFLAAIAIYEGSSCNPLSDWFRCSRSDGAWPWTAPVIDGEQYLIEVFGLDPYTPYKGTGSLTVSWSLGNPEGCCLPDGHCAEVDPAVCESLGGAPQGPGSGCIHGRFACCLGDGECADWDEVFPLCCDDMGGTLQTPTDGTVSTSCSETEACCLDDGTCQELDPLCCDDMGGTSLGPGTQCSGVQEACCMPDGSCLDADPMCCIELGGTPLGAGTQCTGIEEACCLEDGSCIDADPLCCAALGGTPHWGSDCGPPQACCLPDDTCAMLDPLCCTDQGGAPQGDDTMCSPTQACCLPDGSCVEVDPLCCNEMGGSPSPIVETACLGDANSNGVDDACDDCNTNGVADPQDVAGGSSEDCNNNGVPDECESASWTGFADDAYSNADNWRCDAGGAVVPSAHARLINSKATPSQALLDDPVRQELCTLAIGVPGGDTQTLEIANGRDGTELVASIGADIEPGGVLKLDWDSAVEVSGPLTNAEELWLDNDSTLTVEELTNEGRITANAGARISATGDIVSGATGRIWMESATLEAGGCGTPAHIVNHGEICVSGDTQSDFKGIVDNFGTMYLASWAFDCAGFINDGDIRWQPCPFSPFTEGRSAGDDSQAGLTVLGPFQATPSAGLYVGDGELLAGSDFNIAIDDPSRFEFAEGTLQLVGLPGTPQKVEVLAEDVGAAVHPGDPARFTIGELHIGPTPTTVTLVNRHDNAPGRAEETLYVGRLMLDDGITLDLNFNSLYYQQMTLPHSVTILNPPPDGGLLEIDCNDNGVSDSQEIGECAGSPHCSDCNGNSVLDECDISYGISRDCNTNSIPDECEFSDCNLNCIPDETDIAGATSEDCQPNGVPDECDLQSGQSEDCNSNGIPDACESAGDLMPNIMTEPADHVACAGGRVTFSVTAEGVSLQYQWRKDGQDIVDGGGVSGAGTPSLTIDPVTPADAGDYEVIVSNDCGVVISSPASLAVGIAENTIDNGVVRASFTGLGCGSDRYAGPPLSAEIAWLPYADQTQIFTWEGNLNYDDGTGRENHLLADASEFAIAADTCVFDDEMSTESHNNDFRIAATHVLDEATVTTSFEVTNISGQNLTDVNFAWYLDADLNLPATDPRQPCCATYPWLGFGTGRWFGDAGVGVQTNLNHCAGVRPPTISVLHSARMDGSILPAEWTVSNPVGVQGSTCAIDGPRQADARFLFEEPFTNEVGCVGYDQDLGIVTNFGVADWPDGGSHTFTYTLTFRRPGDVDNNYVIDLADFAVMSQCIAGPGVGPVSIECSTFDFDCEDDVDLHDFGAIQLLLPADASP